MTATESFTYRQKTFALDDTEGQTRALHEDGFALVPGVLNAGEIAEARAAIDRLKPFGIDHMGVNEHYKCVFNRNQTFLSYIDRPGIVELAEATLGEQCHIIGETAWRSHPGHNGWGNHTDQIFVPVPEEAFDKPGYRLPIWICTAHYYLNDILTEDYCPTYVIPGSHKSGRSPDKGEETWNGRGLEPVLCKAGDVLYFRSEVWHSGSNNNSDAPRYLIQVHYSHRNIAQKFSPFPWQYNPEILAVATPRQRRLLGEHPESNYG
jgi:ectoine hydroxylase-related dioxygenase (phytanoyl-CoA dioxygenase family)